MLPDMKRTLLLISSAWLMAAGLSLYAPDKTQPEGLREKLEALKTEYEALAREGKLDAAEAVKQKAKQLLAEQQTGERKPEGKGDKTDVRKPEGKGDKTDVRRPEGKGDKPDVRKPEGKGDKPDVRKPEGKGDKPDVRKPEVKGDKPDVRKPEGKGDKPDVRRPEGKGDKPDGRRPEVKGDKGEQAKPDHRAFEEWVQARRAEIDSLKERGEGEAAKKAMHELETQIAAYKSKTSREGVKGGERPAGPGREDGQHELRAWVEKQEQQINALRKAGHNKEAEDMAQKLRASIEAHQGRRGAANERPAGDPEVEKVVAHIQKLRADGQHEQAAKLEQALRAHMAARHGAPNPGRRGGGPENPGEIERLRAEVQELRAALQQLQQHLQEKQKHK